MAVPSSSSAAAAALLPSFFELVAQDRLTSSLRPAWRYVLRVLARQHPLQLGGLVRVADELYFGLLLLLERHYLHQHGTRSALASGGRAALSWVGLCVCVGVFVAVDARLFLPCPCADARVARRRVLC